MDQKTGRRRKRCTDPNCPARQQVTNKQRELMLDRPPVRLSLSRSQYDLATVNNIELVEVVPPHEGNLFLVEL